MKYILLLFFVSVIILLLGLFVGFPTIDINYGVSDEVRQVGQPFEEDFDKEFIRESVFLKVKPAYEQ